MRGRAEPNIDDQYRLGRVRRTKKKEKMTVRNLDFRKHKRSWRGRGRARKRTGAEEAGCGRGWVRKTPGAEEAGACGKDANQKLRFDAE